MSNLVKRLRDFTLPERHDIGLRILDGTYHVITEAADRIERLEEALREISVTFADAYWGNGEIVDRIARIARAALQDNKP